MEFGFATVAAIIVICYLVGEAVKKTPISNKWLPTVCGATGLMLGIVGMYVMEDFPANDIITAMAVGIASGFASTGINQIYKQLKGGNDGT